MSGAACPKTCTVLVPQGQPSSLARSRPAAPQTKRQRPALRFRFSPALGSGSCPLARELLGESEKSRARRSSSRGGESGEAVPRGNLRPLAGGTRGPAGCAHDGHDLEAVAAAAVAICHWSAFVGEGPGPGVRFPPRGGGWKGGGLRAAGLSRGPRAH